MNLEELINKCDPNGVVPLFMQDDGYFYGPDGIKGRWKNYEKDQSKILLVSDADDGIVITCSRKNLVDEEAVGSIVYKENRMSGDRYNLDEAYTEGFLGWSDNATQQKTLAEYFVPKIVERFNPKCVLDVGCGSGQWLDEYRKYNIKTKGVEGSSNAWPTMSDETKEVVLEWDLRDKIEEEDYNVDFVQSFEVAEHIEEEYADIFLYNLIKNDPDTVLLTAAPPDQHGFQHVNCQEKKYWITKMKDKDYLFNQDLLNEIKDWGTPNDCPLWWYSNLMVFV